MPENARFALRRALTSGSLFFVGMALINAFVLHEVAYVLRPVYLVVWGLTAAVVGVAMEMGNRRLARERTGTNA